MKTVSLTALFILLIGVQATLLSAGYDPTNPAENILNAGGKDTVTNAFLTEPTLTNLNAYKNQVAGLLFKPAHGLTAISLENINKDNTKLLNGDNKANVPKGIANLVLLYEKIRENDACFYIGDQRLLAVVDIMIGAIASLNYGVEEQIKEAAETKFAYFKRISYDYWSPIAKHVFRRKLDETTEKNRKNYKKMQIIKKELEVIKMTLDKRMEQKNKVLSRVLDNYRSAKVFVGLNGVGEEDHPKVVEACTNEMALQQKSNMLGRSLKDDIYLLQKENQGGVLATLQRFFGWKSLVVMFGVVNIAFLVNLYGGQSEGDTSEEEEEEEEEE